MATFTRIDHDTLAQLIRANDVVVVDVRSFASYNEAHVKGALRVRLSSLLMRRLATKKITFDDVVVDDECQRWSTRCESTLVCVYDDHTVNDEAPYNDKDALHVILRSLQNQGISSVFLRGGFTSFSQNEKGLVEAAEKCTKSSATTTKAPSPSTHTQKQQQQQRRRLCLLKDSVGLDSLGVKVTPSSYQHHPASVRDSSSPCNVPSTPHLLHHHHHHHQHHHQQHQQHHNYSHAHQHQHQRTASTPSMFVHNGFPMHHHQQQQQHRHNQHHHSPSPPPSMFKHSIKEQIVQPPHRRVAARHMSDTTRLNVVCPSPSARNRSQHSSGCRILDAPVSQITCNLYIGSKKDASNRELLSQLGITHVLNVTHDLDNYFEGKSNLQYLRIPIKDTWNQHLRGHFATAFSFIDAAHDVHGKVLVHCQAGVSRSAAMVVGYLMYSKRLQLDVAMKYVRSKRDIISPNLDFMGELKEYEEDQLACANTNSNNTGKAPTEDVDTDVLAPPTPAPTYTTTTTTTTNSLVANTNSSTGTHSTTTSNTSSPTCTTGNTPTSLHTPTAETACYS